MKIFGSVPIASLPFLLLLVVVDPIVRKVDAAGVSGGVDNNALTVSFGRNEASKQCFCNEW